MYPACVGCIQPRPDGFGPARMHSAGPVCALPETKFNFACPLPSQRPQLFGPGPGKPGRGRLIEARLHLAKAECIQPGPHTPEAE